VPTNFLAPELFIMSERSLWPALHDARLETVESDMAATNIALGFHIAHFNEFAGISPKIRFLLTLTDVRSLIALQFIRDPAVERSVSRANSERGWWESREWSVYAPALRKKNFEVIHPSLKESGDEVTLTLEGLAQGKDWRSLRVMLVVTGARLTAARSDGAPFSLADLEAVGSAYWDAWKRRANTGHST
jgi:hypothetical protein